MISPQPFFTPRGTPFSVYHRTKALSDLGHDVDLATYHLGRDVNIAHTRVLRIPSIPFIKSVKIGPSGKKLFLDVFLFFKCFFLLLRNKYDLIHAHEEAIFFCLVYRIFFWNVPILYDMHSSLPQQLKNFNFSSNKWLIGLFQWLETKAIAHSKAVITICPELQRTVDDLKISTPHVMIENSLCDAVVLSDNSDIITEDLIAWDRFEGRKLVLYTGTFEYYQGLPLLIESVREVVRRFPEVLFILIGGNSQQILSMKKKAKEQGVSKNILFTGNLHPNTVKHFIRRADVLVSPRIHGNNTPLKIYEYLASGKPIVATDHETHTQVLSSKEAVLAHPSALSFADSISQVLSNPEAHASLGHQATQLYQGSYGSLVYMDRLKKVMDLFVSQISLGDQKSQSKKKIKKSA
ncbi:MAG: Phosphatidyl-myo-inositol mannosyltransferase [Elusimicrobia bacterium]|nr:Phosphatidyl-myo-inositol mannosyltransferase [Elusimicrobiota bacterium]